MDAEDAAKAPDPLGEHDLSFDFGEPERYHKDAPSAEVYILDAGHFALDTQADEMASLMKELMKR